MMTTCFDGLSIDLLLEIFDYLSFNELFKAFFGLQQRINNAIRDYPACVDLSTAINCNAFHDDSFRCRSLRISRDDQQQLRMLHCHLNFVTLRAVTFENITLSTLLSLIEFLPMQQLELIKITKINSTDDSVGMHQQIWSVLMATGRRRLHYLHVPHRISRWNINQLTFDLPTLEYVTLEYISTDRMLTFMSHTPNLRHLKAHLYGLDWSENLYTYNSVLRKLNHLTLNIQYLCSFEQLHHLFTMCPNLTHLILKLKAREKTKTIVEPTAWQTLIEQYLPGLIYLRLRLSIFLLNLHERRDFQSRFDRAEYWRRRRPRFLVIAKTEPHP